MPVNRVAEKLKVNPQRIWTIFKHCISKTRAADAFLRQWSVEVDAAKIPAFMKFANTVREHGSGIVHFVESRMTNGNLEGVNSKI